MGIERVVIGAANGQYLYGSITYHEGDLMVVLTSYRKAWVEVLVKFELRRKLGSWERVDPPRKMFAIGGRVVDYVKLPFGERKSD